MRPASRCSLRLAILALSLAGAAYAGPPFVTDDPEPVDFHHWEINLATQQYHSAAGWSGTTSQIDLNYGAAPDLQLQMLMATAYDKPTADSFHLGYGDTEFGVKYRFLHETDLLPQIAFYPLVELPTGNHSEDLGNGKAQVFLPIWIQKKFGDWTTFGGGGYWFNPGPGNRDYWYAGWALERKISSSLNLGAEIQCQSPNTVDSGRFTALNAGGSWDFSDTYHLLFSAGHTVAGPSQFQGYLALQITFGPQEGGKDKK